MSSTFRWTWTMWTGGSIAMSLGYSGPSGRGRHLARQRAGEPVEHRRELCAVFGRPIADEFLERRALHPHDHVADSGPGGREVVQAVHLCDDATATKPCQRPFGLRL